MNWDAIGAIGQMLGSIGVLISIVYLAVQVGHAREEVRRSATLARADANREVWLAFATHPELAKALTKFGSTREWRFPPEFLRVATEEGLSDVEARQVAAFAQIIWNISEFSVEAIEQLSPGGRVAFHSALQHSFGPGSLFETWYRFTQRRLNPDAVRYVDNLLAQLNSTPR